MGRIYCHPYHDTFVGYLGRAFFFHDDVLFGPKRSVYLFSVKSDSALKKRYSYEDSYSYWRHGIHGNHQPNLELLLTHFFEKKEVPRDFQLFKSSWQYPYKYESIPGGRPFFINSPEDLEEALAIMQNLYPYENPRALAAQVRHDVLPYLPLTKDNISAFKSLPHTSL